MKKLQIILAIYLLFFCFPSFVHSQLNGTRDTIYVANWNVENLFDTIDDPDKNDADFLPTSERNWDETRFDSKIKNLTRVINYMNSGCGPDILGLQEVENINVVKMLVYQLRDRDYVIAHRDSPDERGIDAAMIYDRKIFDIIDLNAIHVTIPSGYPTRDIIHGVFLHKVSNSRLHVFVNHWPSRRGGEKKSEINRIAVAKLLRSKVDSLAKDNSDNQIIIMGDFNDEPTNESIENDLGAKYYNCVNNDRTPGTLVNLAYKRKTNNEGSYLFGSQWNMLDQIIVSPQFFDSNKLEYLCDSFEIVKPPFMVTTEGSKKGGPFATYTGTKYLGGYSDHFPVAAKFYFKKGN